jgi:hypothetical protein
MAFKLLSEADCIMDDQTYNVKTFFDKKTNTQRNEYILNDKILFSQEYEMVYLEDVEKDFKIESTIDGFVYWYNMVGPDWRPFEYEERPFSY